MKSFKCAFFLPELKIKNSSPINGTDVEISQNIKTITTYSTVKIYDTFCQYIWLFSQSFVFFFSIYFQFNKHKPTVKNKKKEIATATTTEIPKI